MERGTVTYNFSFPLVLTQRCANRCWYCRFPYSTVDPLPSKKKILKQCHYAAKLGASQIELTAGEGIGESPEVIGTIRYYGLQTYPQYLQLALEAVWTAQGCAPLYPLLHVGNLSLAEMRLLKSRVLGLKLLLETVDQRVAMTEAHRAAPDKAPEKRLETIVNAGRAGIPMTTGIMVGIGESAGSREKALRVLASVQQRYGHIQSVAIQPFRPEPNTPMAEHPAPSANEVVATIATAHKILPREVVIQAPAIEIAHYLGEALDAGARDLGEIDVLHLESAKNSNGSSLQTLEKIIVGRGFNLRERLPLFERFLNLGQYPSAFSVCVREFADKTLPSRSFPERPLHVVEDDSTDLGPQKSRVSA